MSLLAFGINHNTADISVREKVAFNPEQLRFALVEAKRSAELQELAVLSTCNRTEFYCVSDVPEQASARLINWLGDHRQIERAQLQQASYVHQGSAALQHIMKVASGLDSMVLGEPQILGQMKQAYGYSQEASTVGEHLNRIFQKTFLVAKQVRTHTDIGRNPVSVAYAAVHLAKRIFSNPEKNRALLIGAGETIELVGRHLIEYGVTNLVVANRTLERGERLAQALGAKAILLSDIPEQLVHSDIVISSTASTLPLLGKGTVEAALKARKHKPIFMVDLAVPRDIEPQVGDLDDVYLYTVDDLQDVVQANIKTREGAALEAELLIQSGVEDFIRDHRSQEAVGLVRCYRSASEKLRDEQLQSALRMLAKGDDPEKVLATLANRLTNKLIHHPSIRLKQLGAEGRDDSLIAAADLLDLDIAESQQLVNTLNFE
ncbi:MAG: glutamyl-tRNA reductase [Pseudomonadales bacterium]|nr:glutamyl-tRNA reductase [Pseudomonadales bacterium]